MNLAPFLLVALALGFTPWGQRIGAHVADLIDRPRKDHHR